MPAAAGCSPARWATCKPGAAAPDQTLRARAPSQTLALGNPAAFGLCRDDEAEARRLTGVKDPNSIPVMYARLACCSSLVAAGAAACRAAAPAARAGPRPCCCACRPQAASSSATAAGTAAPRRAHLLKKLDYLDSKGLITTTEQFIAQGASANNAWQPVLVRCAGKPAVESPWLTASCSSSGSWLASRSPAAPGPASSPSSAPGSRRADTVDQRKVREGGSGRFQKRIVVLLPVATKLKLRSARA